MPTRYQGTKQQTLALDTFIKLMRAVNALNAHLSPMLDEHGLTASQFAVLEALHHVGPMCLGELARKILRTGGNLTLVARNLERDGLIRRVPSPQDRRVRRMEITSKGKSLIQKVFPAHVTTLVGRMGALTSAEQQELGRLAKKLGIQTPGK